MVLPQFLEKIPVGCRPSAVQQSGFADELRGADYVIVPAMSRDDDPAVLEWLKHQAAKGATIIGVCAGP